MTTEFLTRSARKQRETEAAAAIILGVLADVSARTGISKSDLRDPQRSASSTTRTRARTLCYALCIARGADYNQTAVAFGRTRSAIYHACEYVTELYHKSSEFAREWHEVYRIEKHPGDIRPRRAYSPRDPQNITRRLLRLEKQMDEMFLEKQRLQATLRELMAKGGPG